MNEAQEKSFSTLKTMVVTAPVSGLPDFEKTFILQIDAVNIGIGAILLQEEEDDLKHPIAYTSRKLLPRETAYSTIACLPIVRSINTFEESLYGKEFILEMDHQSLQHLKISQNQNGRVMRWALALQP